MNKLEERGIRVPADNRLARAISLTQAINDDPSQLTVDATAVQHRLLEAFRTLWEAFVISTVATSASEIVELFPNDKLMCLVRGADVPARDSVSSRVRDTQHELLTIALLALGGGGVGAGPPDLRLFYNARVMGVEAKRITSASENREDALRRGLKKASEQIANSTGQGFVSLNLDAWLSDWQLDGDLEAVGQDFTSKIKEAHELLSHRAAAGAIVGAFVFGYLSRFVFEGAIPKLEWHTPMQFVHFSEDEAAVRQATQFWEQLHGTLNQNLTRLIAYVSPSPEELA